MTRSQLDHLVVTAPSLEAGVDYVGSTLGVTPQPGGKHPRMGTHNCLVKLGERVYLEVIAIDPCAPAPGRPRWFELDRLGTNDLPRLAGWVARTSDIRAAAAASPVALGSVEPMSRGTLDWLITVPADGSFALGGTAPALIQWQTAAHPADGLEDQGCRLIRLDIFHSQAESLRGMLDAIGWDDAIVAIQPARAARLVAHVRTRAGMRALNSAP
jgi:hypothetical protein